MAGLAEVEYAAGVLDRAFFFGLFVDSGEDFGAVLLEGDDLGRGGFHFEGVLGLGEGEVELGKNLYVAADVGPFVGNQVREFGEDAPHLLLFLQFQLPHGVVLLDHGQRFDEEGGAARRLIVNDALDLPLVLGSHRYDIAALALGDDRFLQKGDDFSVLYQSVQGTQEPVLGDAQLGADAAQVRGSAVDDLGAVVDAAADFADHVFTGLDGESDIGQSRELTVESRQGIAKCAGAHQGRANLDQLGRNQDTPAFGLCHESAQVVDTAKVDVRLLVKQTACFAGLLHPIADCAQVVAGKE